MNLEELINKNCIVRIDRQLKYNDKVFLYYDKYYVISIMDFNDSLEDAFIDRLPNRPPMCSLMKCYFSNGKDCYKYSRNNDCKLYFDTRVVYRYTQVDMSLFLTSKLISNWNLFVL